MHKKEQLAILYQVLARKTLDTGCMVISKAYKKEMIIEYAFTASWVKHGRTLWESTKDTLYLSYIGYTGDVSEDDVTRVTWHKVMIGDVLKYFQDKMMHFCREVDMENFSWSYWVGDEVWYTLINREHKDLPIEDQSDKYIDWLQKKIYSFK